MLTGDEGQRQAYLAALGIPLWASRQPLPHALSGEALAFAPFVAALSDAPALPGPVMEPFAPYDDDYEPVAVSPAQMAPPPAREPVAAPVVAVPVPRAPVEAALRLAAKNTVGFPRFNFWLKTLPQGWQLIVELGDVPDLSGQEHMLLGQIESALGGFGVTAPTTFRWPLSTNPAIPRDEQSAREAVHFFLKRGRQADSRCLLLGRDLLPFVEGAVPAESLAVGDSLAWLLAEPLRKRELWRSLASVLS